MICFFIGSPGKQNKPKKAMHLKHFQHYFLMTYNETSNNDEKRFMEDLFAGVLHVVFV